MNNQYNQYNLQNSQQGYFYTQPVPNQPVQQAPYGAYQPQYAQPYYPYKKPEKQYRLLTKKDNSMMVLMLLLGFIFFNFAVFSGFNLGFTIFYVLFFIATNLYINAKPSPFAFCTGVLSLASSVTFAVSFNPLIKFLSLVLIVGLYGFYCVDISGGYNFKKGSFKAGFDVVLSYLFYPFVNMPELFGSVKQSSKKNKKFVRVLIGVVVALPVLFIVVPLLVKGDAAFEGLVTAIFKNIGLVLGELLLAVIVAPYLISFMFGKRYKLNREQRRSKGYTGSVPSTVTVSFLSVISLTYMVYIFSQLAYFFSAFDGFLPEDYEKTASAFARRGFFEMFAVCVINVLVISVSSYITKKKGNKLPASVKGLSCFISLFSVLLIVVAMAKMKLNVETYGFTTNRLLVFTFMVMLLFAIGFFILHIFAPKVNYIQPLVVICSALFIALAFLNVDAFVANYNVRAYQQGKLDSVDIDNINNVSGLPYIIELINDENEKISTRAANALIESINWGDASNYIKAEKEYELFEDSGEYSFKTKGDFRRFNLTASDALNKTLAYVNSLDKSEREALSKKAEQYYEYTDYYDGDYASYDDDTVKSYVGEVLGSDVSEAEVLQNSDTHDDFDNVGVYYAELSFYEDSSFIDEVKDYGWTELPMTSELNKAVYGKANNNTYPYASLFEKENFYIPEVENGYYYFVDESAASDNSAASAEELTNFTLAIYDLDTNMLYFVEYDG